MGSRYMMECKCRKNKYIYSGNETRIKEIRAAIKEEALQGKYGEKLQAFVQQNPEGYFDGTLSIYLCSKCGFWENTRCLDYYDLSGKLLRKANARCPKCGVRTKIVPFNSNVLVCPDCNAELRIKTIDLFD